MNCDNYIRIPLSFFSAVTRIVNVFPWTNGNIVHLKPCHTSQDKRSVLFSRTNISKLIIIQRGATIYSLFIVANFTICFGWKLYPSSGAHITVPTASGISHSVWAATSRCRGQIDLTTIAGGSSSDTTTSIWPRQREVAAQTLRPLSDHDSQR
jgi:hypothetical protein